MTNVKHTGEIFCRFEIMQVARFFELGNDTVLIEKKLVVICGDVVRAKRFWKDLETAKLCKCSVVIDFLFEGFQSVRYVLKLLGEK